MKDIEQLSLEELRELYSRTQATVQEQAKLITVYQDIEAQYIRHTGFVIPAGQPLRISDYPNLTGVKSEDGSPKLPELTLETMRRSLKSLQEHMVSRLPNNLGLLGYSPEHFNRHFNPVVGTSGRSIPAEVGSRSVPASIGEGSIPAEVGSYSLPSLPDEMKIGTVHRGPNEFGDVTVHDIKVRTRGPIYSADPIRFKGYHTPSGATTAVLAAVRKMAASKTPVLDTEYRILITVGDNQLYYPVFVMCKQGSEAMASAATISQHGFAVVINQGRRA